MHYVRKEKIGSQYFLMHNFDTCVIKVPIKTRQIKKFVKECKKFYKVKTLSAFENRIKYIINHKSISPRMVFKRA